MMGKKLSSCILGVNGKQAGGNGKQNLLLFEPKDTANQVIFLGLPAACGALYSLQDLCKVASIIPIL